MNNIADLWDYERAAFEKGITIVCGIDEAGRGPLAGPVYAAAVILPFAYQIEGLNDSKKVTPKKREQLFDVIQHTALSYGIASADENEIDELNILNATFLAMRRAVYELSMSPQLLLIDGNRAKGFDHPTQCIIGGDGKSASIAAASILAKVSRDRYMLELAGKYPQYGFEIHKGYPTKKHVEAILKYGPCEVHRQSFLKKILKPAHI